MVSLAVALGQNPCVRTPLYWVPCTFAAYLFLITVTVCLFEDGFDRTGVGLVLFQPCLEAATVWASRRGGDGEMGIQTQSPVGGVTRVGVQEGEQVLHWKLSVSAHSSGCGNTGIHVPDGDSPAGSH